ncbi:MAG TPA: hypothetical protein VHM70_01775 [Polyangiaceae bacterium]|nr:hypothetical protein [Polyangiaceae bacterium]
MRKQREVELISTLLHQHRRGRPMTLGHGACSGATVELEQALRKFACMYRSHAERDDTVLFPAFRGRARGLP